MQYLHENASITFDPKIGYTLHESGLSGLIGDYVCTVGAVEPGPVYAGGTIFNGYQQVVDEYAKDVVHIRVDFCVDGK